MQKCKTKAIQADIGIFTHILAYSDTCKHKQAYSQAYSEPSVTLAYLEPWYIQNQKHIQNRDVFRTLAYSEPWHIQNLVKHLLWSVFAKIVIIIMKIIIFITSAFKVLYFMKKKILFF